VALNTVAKQKAGVDVEQVSGTFGTVAVGVDGDGQATAGFVDEVVDGEIGGRRNVRVAVKGEGSASAVRVEAQDGECKPEVASILPFDGNLGPVGAGVLPTTTAAISAPSKPIRAPQPRHSAVSNLDGAQDERAPDRDVEAQRDDGGNESTAEPKPPGLLHSSSFLRLTYILRTTLTLKLLLLQIPLTLTIFALWALIPHPPLPHNTFGIEFVFLATGFIGFVLLLIGREAPRFKCGVLGGVEGYREVLMGRSGKRKGFWWDVCGEALVLACFGVVLGLKARVLGGGEGGACLKGLVIGGDKEVADKVEKWGWRKGGVSCNRLTTVVSLLGWEV
jgi:hypothetical protein